MTKEDQIKKIRNIVGVLASQWLLTKHFGKEARDAVKEFAGWMDILMNEKEELN